MTLEPAEFTTLLVGHPLMLKLLRLLVWAATSKRAPLHFSRGRGRADRRRDDSPLTLTGQIGVVHPLQLPTALQQAWGKIFADYLLLSPFPQLGRPVYTLTEGEKAGTDITRYKDGKIPAPSLVSTLERLGWVRGITSGRRRLF